MDYKKSGELIYQARKEKGYTQKEVADKLNVSDKAVSKWERGAGCPDVRILSDLADVLDIDPKVLLSGIAACNEKDNGNLKNLKFYVCPICGNIITSTGTAEIACCGKKLKELAAGVQDSRHQIVSDIIEGDYYISMEHPMTKKHYISFLCYVTCDKYILVKLYPEQSCEMRFRRVGHGYVYAYCNEDGLFRIVV